MESIRAGLRWLPEDERDLLDRTVCAGEPVSAMVPAASRREVRRLRRRARRVVNRVMSARFQLASRLVDRVGATWSEERRAVIVGCVLHGRSVREMAAVRSITYYDARRHVMAFRMLSEGGRP